MKRAQFQHHRKNILSFSFLGLGLFVFMPAVTFAQVETLVSDGLNVRGGNLGSYFNNLFDYSLLAGGIIAVLVIAYAGLQYMSTDAVSGKQESKERITQAVLGILMLLGVALFFNEINPAILNLDFDLAETKIDTTATQEAIRRAAFSNTTGGSYINPEWSEIPPNQSCVDVKGGGWVIIDDHHCPGVNPGKRYYCCGEDPNFKPNNVNGSVDSVDNTGNWCLWGNNGSECYDNSNNVPNGSWCYRIEGDGAQCFPSRDVCEATDNEANESISSCEEVTR